MINTRPGAPPASADGAPADSAMTKSGTGEFANLQVTVSQTKNLINQTVVVTWKGGVQTEPITGGPFSADYLQIMQCWGDDPAGPDRSQCQFGASGQSVPAAGAWVRSRQVTTTVVDPKETLTKPVGAAYVPFWPIGHPQPTGPGDGDQNDFFDSQVTNEVPLARTSADGTGLAQFEIETVREAAGLGCGDPVNTGGVTKGRSCWLVVVPRGDTEVDGSVQSGDQGHQLLSSPLSQTNWDKRIVFPLEFLPVGQACPIGAPDHRSRARGGRGHQLAAGAVHRRRSAVQLRPAGRRRGPAGN
ncbi:MAG: hypothetical protein ACRDQU_13590 [Pseudonocardiaceae bacterium]